MKNKQPKKKRSATLQDLVKAEMDPVLQYRMRQRTKMPALITTADKLLIRKFARKSLPLARQRNSKITQPQLEQNLVAALKKVKPKLRKVILRQMKEDVSG